MDLVKIGEFIKQKRKEKELTQAALATKLHITNKSVSKWENGRCMPDVSLIEPLCKELGITINDLLNGEIVDKKEYEQKLELNLIESLKNNKELLEKKNKIIGGLLFSIIFSLIIIVFLFLNQIKNEIQNYTKDNDGLYPVIINCYTNSARIDNISKIIEKYYKMVSFDKNVFIDELFNSYSLDNLLISNNYQDVNNVKYDIEKFVQMLEVSFKRDKENNVQKIDTKLYAKMFLSTTCYQNNFTSDYNESSNELNRVHDILNFMISYIYIFTLTMAISYFMINIDFKMNKKYVINVLKIILILVSIVFLKEILYLLLAKYEYNLINKIPYYSYSGDYEILQMLNSIKNIMLEFKTILKEVSIFIIISLGLNVMFNLILKKLKLVFKRY